MDVGESECSCESLESIGFVTHLFVGIQVYVDSQGFDALLVFDELD
jgi:hypothetical protein